MNIINPSSGTSFVLKKNYILSVIDIDGAQVSDLFCASMDDTKEKLSCARSLDYNDGIYLSEGDLLYSNRSQVMLEIVKDTCGRHDVLMPPCSLKMFQIVAGDSDLNHRSCHENLWQNLKPYAITPDEIDNTFNIFMNVTVSEKGFLKIDPPTSRQNDIVSFRAHMDLIVGLTACSHEETNGGKLKRIAYDVHGGGSL